VHPGEIYYHERFYRDAESGELKPKYIVLLARGPGGDWIARLLTSRASLRTENPPCDHSDPYPGYYLGVPGAPLTRRTWVDLRALPDLDSAGLATLRTKGILKFALKLNDRSLADVLECAAGAPDTTSQQEKALRDGLALLR
jgi:hypothetical protein